MSKAKDLIKKHYALKKANEMARRKLPESTIKIFSALKKETNIFKDLKVIKEHVAQFNPHIYFNINSDSKKYLKDLKLKLAEGGTDTLTGIPTIIFFCDIYFIVEKEGVEFKYLDRIGFSLKVKEWVFLSVPWYGDGSISLKTTYKWYKKYSDMLEAITEYYMTFFKQKDLQFNEPFPKGSFFNMGDYKGIKKITFADNAEFAIDPYKN